VLQCSASASSNKPVDSAGELGGFDGGYDASFYLNSNLPVRVVPVEFDVAPAVLGTAIPYDAGTLGPSPPVIIPSSPSFTWQQGGAAPGARPVLVTPSGQAFITMTPSTASGGSWLSVSFPTGSSAGYTFPISVNPSQLAVGTYQGSMLVSQSWGPSANLPVTLTVTSAPVSMISANPTSITFTAPASNAPPYTQTSARHGSEESAVFFFLCPDS
jgi:hypothetical protein